MKEIDLRSLDYYLKKDYIKTITIINNIIREMFEENNKNKIVLDDDLIKTLFLKEINNAQVFILSQPIKKNDKEIEWFKLLENLSEMIDFSSLEYNNLATNKENLEFMKKHNISLNPQKVIGRNLSYSDLNGLVIEGSFDQVDIRYTNFKGSKGAIINPQTIKNLNCSGTKFADVTIIGTFNGVYIENTDFTKSVNTILTLNDIEKVKYSCEGLKDTTIVVPDNFEFSTFEEKEIYLLCLEKECHNFITESQYMSYLNNLRSNIFTIKEGIAILTNPEDIKHIVEGSRRKKILTKNNNKDSNQE